MLYEFIGTTASSTKGNLTVSNVCNLTEILKQVNSLGASSVHNGKLKVLSIIDWTGSGQLTAGIRSRLGDEDGRRRRDGVGVVGSVERVRRVLLPVVQVGQLS